MENQFVNQFVAVYSHYNFYLEQLLEFLPKPDDEEYATWADYDYFYWGCWKCFDNYAYVIQISNYVYNNYLAKLSRFPLKMRIGMKLKKFYWAGKACVKQDVVYHWNGAQYPCGLSFDDLTRNRAHFMDVISKWMSGRGSPIWICDYMPFVERLVVDVPIINEAIIEKMKMLEFEEEARCCK